MCPLRALACVIPRLTVSADSSVTNNEQEDVEEKPKDHSSFFGLNSAKKIDQVPEFSDSDEDD